MKNKKNHKKHKKEKQQEKKVLPTLTEEEWHKVLQLRIQVKNTGHIEQTEAEFLHSAWMSDRKRYDGLSEKVREVKKNG